MPSDKPTKSLKPRKVIDVTGPGGSAPSASSRPIIVSNRPILKRDPMVIGSQSPGNIGLGDTPKISRTIKVIPASAEGDPAEILDKVEVKKNQPLLSPLPEKETVATTLPATETLPEPAAEAVTSTPTSSPAEDSPEPGAPASENSAPKEALPSSETDAEMNDSLPNDAETAQAETDEQLAPNKAFDDAKRKAEEEKAAKLAEQEKVIESKKYFLPINAVEKRRSTRRALLVLIVIIVIAVVWIDLVLDAGLLRIGGIHPLTHFFTR